MSPQSYQNASTLLSDCWGWVERETGRRPTLSASGGTSDARFIRVYCPVLEFGLVGATAHIVDEHVSIAELEGLTEIYAAILEEYFRKE